MSTAPNTAHQGMFIENGRYVPWEFLTMIIIPDSKPSGGFMGDLIFNGGKMLFLKKFSPKRDSPLPPTGKFGMWVGNQQWV